MTQRVRTAPKADVMEDLIASLEEAARIVAGDVAPARVHHAAVIAEMDVRAARQRMGMTQSAFAARLGMALPTLREWE